jgi:hypothetical protein
MNSSNYDCHPDSGSPSLDFSYHHPFTLQQAPLPNLPDRIRHILITLPPDERSVQHYPRATVQELTPRVRIGIRTHLERVWINLQNAKLGLITSTVSRPHRSAGVGVCDRVWIQRGRERSPVSNHSACNIRVGSLGWSGLEERLRSSVKLSAGVEDELVDR